MRSAHVVIDSPVSRSVRCRQLEALFDVPVRERQKLEWSIDTRFDEKPWSVGLIVGPSGAGKTTIARELFGAKSLAPLKWRNRASVIDEFDDDLEMTEISAACQAVGFNTVPAWLRPYDVLSNGEKFRVELARRILEGGKLVVVDEFTSVVDRQVAKIAAHAAQKFVRRRKSQLVAVTCHYDVVEWLQPDWIIEPHRERFAWRELRPRPKLAIKIAAVDYSAWRLFAPFHYLTAELAKSARCYCLFVGDQPAAFVGVLHRPHDIAKNIKGNSRTVTLPDWQGLGLAFILTKAVASAYTTFGWRFRNYPAHPSFIRAHAENPDWRMAKMPGTFSREVGETSSLPNLSKGRPCAVFEYVGEPMNRKDATTLLRYDESALLGPRT